MATTPQKFQIRIESILGGHSRTRYFAAANQFQESLGIDPGQGDGIIYPIPSKNQFNGAGIPFWILPPTPKVAQLSYIYDSTGSVYSYNPISSPAVTALSDAGEMTGGVGNGAAYYDNYVYFSKNTTI